MSLRLRLTLLYTAILALTLIVFSVALYTTVREVTFRVAKDTLADEAQRLIDSGQVQYDRGVLLIVPQVGKFPKQETFVQTLLPTGEVTDRAANTRDFEFVLPLSAGGLRGALRGQPQVESGPTDNGRLLIYNKPVTNSRGQVIGVLQVARSVANQDQALDTLKRFLIIGTSIVPLIAFGIGWLLSRIALRPIGRITRTAQAIGAERDFSRRVAYDGPPDEIGRLATTFNAMLAALQAAHRQTEQALQAQRRFVADASHELRTPLTTVRGNLGLLQRRPPIGEEDRVAALADMVAESERMSRLVNDLLLLARADAGRPLRAEPVALAPLLDDVCRQARLLAPERAIDGDEPGAVAVTGDPDALKQVLLILLDNALRFTPANGTIAVTTAVDGGRVAIGVRDRGAGIAPDILPHIFERFYRGDAARTGAGAGLGLAIAKALVEAQRGTIAVESRVGEGSTFTVTLPQASAARIDEPSQAAQAAFVAAGPQARL